MMKKSVSLSLAWMFLISAVSGVVLYIAPPGRIAYWGGWSFAGFDKEQWDHLHTVTTLLMLIAAALHLYFNWRPFVSYMKSKTTQALAMTRELLISLIIALTVASGALMQWPPFEWIIDLGDHVSEDWEKGLGSPPYGHAELDTMGAFMGKMQIDREAANGRLKRAGIVFDANATIKSVAQKHGMTPQKLYNLMQSEGTKNTKAPLQEGSGLGKKSLSQVCEIRELDPDKVVEKLHSIGIEADPQSKFKTIAEEAGKNPMDLLIWIEE